MGVVADTPAGDSEGRLLDRGGDGDAAAETAHVSFCPIRFQGQWEDAETGLYQNRFRYYDPGAGQFASRDPIGLLGGTSVTGYVDTPSVFIDAMGLEPHHATWILRDTLGNVIGEGALSSGSIISPGRRLTFPEQLATQQRQKYSTNLRAQFSQVRDWKSSEQNLPAILVREAASGACLSLPESKGWKLTIMIPRTMRSIGTTGRAK